MNRKAFYIWILCAFVGAVILVGYTLKKNEITGGKPSVITSSSSQVVGGPFELVDHTGKTVTHKDYQGKLSLVFFGYTYCPDVCPTTLQLISDVLALLEGDGDKITPLYITVDPQRDTVEVMNEYVSNFDARIVGLTGTDKQVSGAVKSYRAYAKKVTEQDSEPDEYLMNHTAYLYLMNSEGVFINAFSHQTEPKVLATAIRDAL